jgi:hypothetical protein
MHVRLRGKRVLDKSFISARATNTLEFKEDEQPVLNSVPRDKGKRSERNRDREAKTTDYLNEQAYDLETKDTSLNTH